MTTIKIYAKMFGEERLMCETQYTSLAMQIVEGLLYDKYLNIEIVVADNEKYCDRKKDDNEDKCLCKEGDCICQEK